MQQQNNRYDYQVNQDKLDVHWDTLKNDLKKIWSPTLKK